MSDKLIVPARAYAMVYMQRRYGAVGVIYGLLVVAGIVAGFSDVRWGIVTLMAIFILTPMVLTMAWLTAIGRRDLPMRLHPFTLEMNDDELIISYYSFECVPPYDDGGRHGVPPYDDCEDIRPIKSLAIQAKDIANIHQGSKYTRLDLNTGADFDFILLPKDIKLPQNLLQEYEQQTLSD